MSSVSAQTVGPQKRTLSLVRRDLRPSEEPGPIGFDEMWGRDSIVREPYGELAAWLDQIPAGVLDQRRREAELVFRRIGITFAVYGESEAQERLIPFDVIPRILSMEEWQHVESGIVQRLTAINLLLDDVYHQQHILRNCVIPAELILANRNYRPLMHGIDLPHKTYVNIWGTDIDGRG